VYFQLARDLLHPSPEEERRRHKLKRLVQHPNSYFMDVKCPGKLEMLELNRKCGGRVFRRGSEEPRREVFLLFNKIELVSVDILPVTIVPCE